MKRREDLTMPRRRRRLGVHYDPDAFGQFSESIARTLGTARFLIFQSVICFLWLGWNITVPEEWKFDPNPFGVLTLALSLQAAYAAPLILLAQNRQEDRDRQQSDVDRSVAARTQADTEFLARELAAVRLALADMVTMDELRDQLDKLSDQVDELSRRVAPPAVPLPE
jgi:uncharacterized membrane protein